MPASSRVLRTRFATGITYAGIRPLTRENALMLATLPIGRGQSSPTYAPVPVGDEHHRNGDKMTSLNRRTDALNHACTPNPTHTPRPRPQLDSAARNHISSTLHHISRSPGHSPSKPSGRELVHCTARGFPCTFCGNCRNRHPPLHAIAVPADTLFSSAYGHLHAVCHFVSLR